MNVVAIVQARMNAKRLPGKVLADLEGKPLLDRVLTRVSRSKFLDSVVVATSTNPLDDAIVKFCTRENWPYYRGSEEDVLDRFYQAARLFQADTIVRITADCPFVDPDIVDKVAMAYLGGATAYTSNVQVRTYPKGLDVEAFSMGALKESWKESTKPRDREHVTLYIRERPKIFGQQHVITSPNYSNLRWTVDTQEDLDFARRAYRWLGTDTFSWKDLLGFKDE